MLEYKSDITGSPDAPLVYLVHGRAGNRDVMWTFRRCVPEGWNVIAPEAPLSDPLGGCSWWQVHPDGSRHEEILDAVDRLGGFMESIEKEKGLTPPFRLALGFSQGAGLLSVISQKEPSRFRGIGLLAGFVIQISLAEHGKEELPSILVCHGSLDELVTTERALSGVQYLRSLGASVEYVEDPVGHKVGTAAMRRLKSWFGEFAP